MKYVLVHEKHNAQSCLIKSTEIKGIKGILILK